MCIQKQLDLLSTYDQNVDVVSCWEYFLDSHYRMSYKTLFFDRFPQIPMPDGKRLMPDFTAFFTEEYAMAFEISRTYPRNQKGLAKEIDQLSKYDEDIPVFSGKEFVHVSTYDIVLLLNAVDSTQIAHRISQFLKEESRVFTHNLVIMEYNLTTLDRQSFYYFRKVPTLESTFTNFFPEELGFKEIDRNYEKILVKIEDMMEYKVNGVFCNDQPPRAYLAGYIWHRIFYDYLSDRQRQLWRERNPRLTIPIEVHVDDLTAKVKRSTRQGKIRKGWIKATLEYLTVCGLAEKLLEDSYKVKYRNLYPILEARRRDELHLERDLAAYFIERFCKEESGIREEKGEMRQKYINDFI